MYEMVPLGMTQKHVAWMCTYLRITERTDVDVVSTNGTLPFRPSVVLWKGEHANLRSVVIVAATVGHAASPHRASLQPYTT